MRALAPAVLGDFWAIHGFSIGTVVKLRFGELTFDADTRQLVGADGEVHLSPKAFELLRILVEHRPRSMSKNELHELLWPATFVSEANLASLVAEIRDSLGDDARHPRFVRTAHRFGYAFCGEATLVAESARLSEAASFSWLLKDGRRLPLRIGENILGRDDDVIQIDSPTVSRRHARIVITAVDALLEDLGSKNGTFTQGAPVSTPVRLTDGDELRIGSVVLRFRMTLPKGATATWSGDEQS